jgi:hypothetical protein
MYKSGNDMEYFSELFICKMGEKLGMNMAHYEMDGDYIRSKDFTNGASVNFEPMKALVDSDDDYETCFNVLNNISSELAKQYLILIWMDSICYNMDRHTENFGFLRDINNGNILALAPNYDNNIAFIAKGYLKDETRASDGLIKFFKEFVQNNSDAREMYREINLPLITEEIINECLDEISIDVDRDYIRTFILSGQSQILTLINQDYDISENEDDETGLML